MALAKQERGVAASMQKGNGNGGHFDVQPMMRLSDDKYLVSQNPRRYDEELRRMKHI